MARKDSVALPEEETASEREVCLRSDVDDARLVDLDENEQPPFLRAQRRVSARRSPLPKKTAKRLKWVGIAAGLLVVVGVLCAVLYNYGERSWRFRIQSSDQIEIAGTHNVTRPQIMEVMGGDIGRNIFFVPLDQRKAQLEQIPWVESAAVMRFVPNRLKIEIRERTPVAFVRIGSRIGLMDAGGHIMELPAHGNQKFSFPVIVGTSDSEPLSTRAARMKAYNELVRELDSDGARYSQDLSEVDVSDPEDVKILVNDPSGEVLVHLGSGSYLDRYKIYRAHVQEWRQQFEKLESVDLRYDRQIIVNPDLRGAVKPAPISPTAVKAAVAAGVPAVALTAAALVQHHKEEAKAKAAAAKKSAHNVKVAARQKAATSKAQLYAKAARHAAKPVARSRTKAPTAATTVKPVSAKPASSRPAATVYGPPPPRQVLNGSRGKPRPGVPKD